MSSKILESVGQIAIGIIIAFIILKTLGFGLGTRFPVVSIVSGSMRHDGGNFDAWVQANGMQDEIKNWKYSYGLKEGDMIVIIGATEEGLKIGDVVVYSSLTYNYPVIHRIIGIQNGTYIIKGDHNPVPDPLPVNLDQIEGKAIIAVPGLGIPRFVLHQVIGI